MIVRHAIVSRPSHACAGALLAALAVSACHPTEHFESVCQIIRRDAVERSPDGSVEQVDLELEWDPCPGDQFQVIRGGAAFARCTAQYRIGDLVPVKVVHWWDSRGYYVWDIERVGDCARTVEASSEGSYEKSQECRDTALHGRRYGFECNRRPNENLVSVCPWTAR